SRCGNNASQWKEHIIPLRSPAPDLPFSDCCRLELRREELRQTCGTTERRGRSQSLDVLSTGVIERPSGAMLLRDSFPARHGGVKKFQRQNLLREHIVDEELAPAFFHRTLFPDLNIVL